ncbi:MAG: pseudouridine synthase, partial [Rectinema sp.]|nr:pseudouridine synthase [Rectinema sp.]
GWHSIYQHRSRNDLSGPDLVSWLAAQAELLPESELKETAHQFEKKSNHEHPVFDDRYEAELGLLYRLDRETSGLMLAALSRRVFHEFLHAQTASNLVKKYILLSVPATVYLEGFIPPAQAPDTRFIARHDSCLQIESKFRSYGPRGARVACIDPSRTSRKLNRHDVYRTSLTIIGNAREIPSLNRNIPPDTVLFEAEIRKGFRHQIRAHCAWYGFPILGDSAYGGAVSERLWLQAYEVRLESNGRVSLKWSLGNPLEQEYHAASKDAL